MKKETYKTEDGKTVQVTVKEKKTDEEIIDILHLDNTITKVSLWVFAFLTFIVGDVATTYYATQYMDLTESNLFVLMSGLHANPIAFIEFKMYIMLVVISITILGQYTLKFFNLDDIKAYFGVIPPFIIGVISFVIVLHNLTMML